MDNQKDGWGFGSRLDRDQHEGGYSGNAGARKRFLGSDFFSSKRQRRDDEEPSTSRSSFQEEAKRILAGRQVPKIGEFGRPPPSLAYSAEYSHLLTVVKRVEDSPSRTVLLPPRSTLQHILQVYSLLCPGGGPCSHGQRTLEGMQVCGGLPAPTHRFSHSPSHRPHLFIRLGEGRPQLVFPCAARAATFLRLLETQQPLTGLAGEPGDHSMSATS